MILTVASTKGGVGKSTLCVNLGLCLIEMGHPVFFLDADRQGTLSAWADVRLAAGHPPVRIATASGPSLMEIAGDKSKAGDFVIIDTAGADTAGTRAAMAAADAILTASSPSPADLWELSRLEKMIDELGRRKGAPLPWYLLINRAHPSARDFGYVADYLKDASIYPNAVLSATVRQRSAYVDSVGGGLSVGEMQDEKAKQEMKDVCTELLTLLGWRKK